MLTRPTFLLLISALHLMKCDEEPLVQTRNGHLKGTRVHIPGFERHAFAFLNIPFGAPPTGEHRFQPPQPPESWQGIRDASQHGAACAQVARATSDLVDEALSFKRSDLVVSEDCLHLNVYTPSLQGARAVMVWIHGGALIEGWAGSYDMRGFAIVEDVVVVVIQYRLGPLGWLSTGDDVVEGNMGFLDQVAALHWVQDNIALFGGDPTQVTIFGESAGSWSVTFHVVSPLSAGLFHRAIMQSGSPEDSPFMYPPANATKAAMDLATELGCPTDSSKVMVSCLQRQPLDKLMNPSGRELVMGEVIWFGRVDGKAIPLSIAELINTAYFNTETDIMAGVTQTEGVALFKMRDEGFTRPDFDREKFKMATTNLMAVSYPNMPWAWGELADMVTEMYAGSKTGGELSLALADVFGDWFLVCPTYKTAQGIKDKGKGNVFFYELSQRPSRSTKPHYVISDHTDDLYFMTGTSYLGRAPYSEDDKHLEKMMMSYWANFARNGDPNGDGLPMWKSLKENNSYITLKTTPEVNNDFKSDKMLFWQKTIPEKAATLKRQESAHEEL